MTAMKDCDPPNLLIIGAPKCATTSMFDWLAAHPQTAVSKKKEPWFFADQELDFLDFHPNHRDDGPDAYPQVFEPVSDSTRVKMEGTPHYLYSRPAFDYFSGLETPPRLIVQIRDPAKRIWSHFNYINFQADKPIPVSFPDYVSMLLDEPQGTAQHFSDEPWPQFLLGNQISYSSYHRHLALWLRKFPHNHFRILVLENLGKEPRGEMIELANWAGIDSDFYSSCEFTSSNVTSSRAAKDRRNKLRGPARILPGFMRSWAKLLLTQLEPPPPPPKKTPDDEAAIARLSEYFEPENRRLADEFGLDLTAWRRG